MSSISLASLRLGKTSVEAIKNLNNVPAGLTTPFEIKVKCTQVPQEFDKGAYVLIWLGSDNSKGMPTSWKQGYKAFGRVKSVERGKQFNDESANVVEILYSFDSAVNRLDFLKYAPEAYYDCSAMPIIGIDDHSNQTIRMLQGSGERYSIGAMFYALNVIDSSFKASLLQINSDLIDFFSYLPPSLKKGDRDPRYETGVNNTIQTIYYGCPGTGKSHQVKDLTEGLKGEKTIKFEDGKTNVFRTTFHPDYDYATFVGCYKPVKENDKLDYKFVPQVFTNAYVTAKKHPETPIYLIIEEINRGNCAQIFGDLFQLLDRENGESKFPIDAEEELMKYLRDEAQLDEYIKIKLPANFNIYATMNTSDQSLFPMDSAFKRRWEMKYIKIDYTNTEADYTFNVGGKDYHWLDYLPCINDKITLATDSEDKQMGEFFIRSNMSTTEFKNKVMFYLWNDVCKDLYAGTNSPQSFFFRDLYGKPFKFTELFNEPAPDASEEDKKDPRKNGDLLLEGFLYYVKNGKKKAPKTEAITEQTVEEPEDGGEQPAE